MAFELLGARSGRRVGLASLCQVLPSEQFQPSYTFETDPCACGSWRITDAASVLQGLRSEDILVLQDPEREADTEKATDLMERVTNGEQPVIQPGHWILEVGAVLARVSPETAADDVTLLAALELPATDDPLVVRRGAELAVELQQHLFDTFYHAIALENPDAVLVTADEHYLRAAQSKGRIMHVRDWVEGLEADVDV